MPVEPDPRVLAAIFDAVSSHTGARPMVLGICGAQGSGKSTLARAVEEAACAKGIPAATLSLDDLYLTRAERDELARSVHPLLRTRGVPGTHDVGIGLAVLDALGCGEAVRLPRFDKASDDRFPPSRWSRAPEGNQLLIMEGWCLGARPQDRDALREPINVLEGQDDPEGIWRRYANDALAGVYQTLFARIDVLVLLAAPSFDVVFDWRLQQEQELRESVGPDAPGLMSATGVARFVEHYERLTRHILAEMPPRADILVSLAEDRSPLEIRVSAASR